MFRPLNCSMSTKTHRILNVVSFYSPISRGLDFKICLECRNLVV